MIILEDFVAVLAEKDSAGLALLLLEATKSAGWAEDQEEQVGNEIISAICFTRQCRQIQNHG